MPKGPSEFKRESSESWRRHLSGQLPCSADSSPEEFCGLRVLKQQRIEHAHGAEDGFSDEQQDASAHHAGGGRCVDATHGDALPRVEALQAAVLAGYAQQPVRRAQSHLRRQARNLSPEQVQSAQPSGGQQVLVHALAQH